MAAPTATGRRRAGMGIGLELLALAAIRNNLTLDVLVLLHSIDAIRRWRGG